VLKSFKVFVMLLCCSCGTVIGSQPTKIEPLPIKFGLKDSSIVIGIPVVTQEKKSGGYRSPIEARFELLMTSPAVVRIPVKPTGVVSGIRWRW